MLKVSVMANGLIVQVDLVHLLSAREQELRAITAEVYQYFHLMVLLKLERFRVLSTC